MAFMTLYLQSRNLTTIHIPTSVILYTNKMFRYILRYDKRERDIHIAKAAGNDSVDGTETGKSHEGAGCTRLGIL